MTCWRIWSRRWIRSKWGGEFCEKVHVLHKQEKASGYLFFCTRKRSFLDSLYTPFRKAVLNNKNCGRFAEAIYEINICTESELVDEEGNKFMAVIQDRTIEEERKKIIVKEAMNACPIDFSKFQSSNPRANTVQKEYQGQDASNFNNRQNYSDDEAPQFTVPFGDGAGELPVEPGRYRLIWSRHCPWANRVAIVLALLGLDRVISQGVVDPLRPAGVVGGWYFTLDPGNVDPVLKVHALMDSYKKADPSYKKRATVPAIVDTLSGKVVNNDYHHLTTELETAWEKYIVPGAPDLYPEDRRADIDALNDIIYSDVNLAVNLAAMVESQEEYEHYYDVVFNRLDWLEERLSHQRYLMGHTITDPDVRLYVTLTRFDLVFYQKYFVNKKRLVDYPNLWNYAKDLYSIPAFGNNTDFDSMKKRFYYVDHTPFKDFPRLVPKGPDLSIWNEPNDRGRFKK
jgi:putative glutathione S-transferase